MSTQTTDRINGVSVNPNVPNADGSAYDATKAAAASTGEPTIGQTYKSVNAGVPTPYDSELSREGGALKGTADTPVNEDAIRQQTLQMFQAEIDATNGVYADKLAEAKTQGLGRLGSTRAISARSGTLGSDFGAAQKDKVVGANNDIEQSINNEKLAAIAAITGKASQQAATEIAAKRQAQQQGLTSYLAYLSGQADRTKGKLDDLSQTFLSQGVAPSEIDPTQLQDIATKYGVSTDDILASYGIAKKTKDAADAKLKTEGDNTKFDQDLKTKQLALSQQQADADAAYKRGELSLGQYNAQTSRITALSGQYKAGLDASGNPISGQASSLKTDALTSAKALLDKFTKGDGTSAVGMSRALGLQNIPGSAPADFQIQYNNLKSLLSLDNVKLLKGQGAISENERKLLADASTKLNLAQSEGEFKTTLTDLVTALSGETGADTTGANGNTTGSVNVTDPNGVVHTFPDQASADSFKKAAGL